MSQLSRVTFTMNPVRLWVSAIMTKAVSMGAVLAVVLRANISPFIQGIIIATVSAIITGLFVFLTAVYTVTHTRPIQAELHDVKRKVEADRRESDNGGNGDNSPEN